MAELRGLSRECSFLCKNSNCGSEFSDELIRDLIILYTPDEPIRTAALHKDDPTLKEVLQIAETFETTQKTVSSIKAKETDDNEIFLVRNSNNRKQEKRQQWPACAGCFKNHNKETCKYLKAQCYICKKIGHIAPVCKSKPNAKNHIWAVEEESSIFSCDASENVVSRAGNKMIIDLKLNGKDVKFQFDTGAMRSVIGVECYKSLGRPTLKTTSVKL